MNAVLEDLRRQSILCTEFGSPFTGQLLSRAADDLAAGGIVATLVANWPGNPKADAVALRLAGALHAAVLTGRDGAMADQYPAGDPYWSMDDVWPAAEALLRRDEAWVRAFMQSPPQTNETARSSGLVAAFLWLAERIDMPFHMMELGASAGLNLNWDSFRFAHPSWGRRQGAGPLIPTVISGQAPYWRSIAVASRAACDQNPLDASSEADRLRLRAYVWADQPERMARLNAAMEIAVAAGVKVDKADAAEWVRGKLEAEAPAGLRLIYHSVFFQYPPRDVRAGITDAIETAGARATIRRPLAWVRFEPEAVIGGPHDSARYVLNVVLWDGSGRTEATLAEVDPHGRTMIWTGA